MKSAFLLGAVAVGGVAMYFYSRKQASLTNSPVSNPSNYQPAQPSLKYPWSAIFPPRVDNQNQPYANGSKAPFMQGLSSQVAQNPLGAIQAGSSVVHSLSDVWGSLSDAFGGNDSKSNLTVAPADAAVPDMSSMGSDSLPAGFDDQSNVVGDQVDSTFANATDSSSDYTDMSA